MTTVQQKSTKSIDPSFVHNVKILKTCLETSKSHVCTITLTDGRQASKQLSHRDIDTLIHSLTKDKIFLDGISSNHYSEEQIPLSERKAITLLLAEIFQFESNSSNPLIAPPETKQNNLTQKMLAGFVLGHFVSLAYFYSKANEAT